MTIRRVSGACMLQAVTHKQEQASTVGQMMSNQQAICAVFANELNQARQDLEEEMLERWKGLSEHVDALNRVVSAHLAHHARSMVNPVIITLEKAAGNPGVTDCDEKTSEELNQAREDLEAEIERLRLVPEASKLLKSLSHELAIRFNAPKPGEKTPSSKVETTSETASKSTMRNGELSLIYLLDVVNHKLKYMNKQKLSGVAVVTTSDVIYMLEDLSTRIKSEIEKIQTAQI